MPRKILALASLLAALAFVPPAATQSKSTGEGNTVKILRQTPILTVDAIEPHLAFYEKRLGYKRLAEVPHGDKLGFIMLEQNNNHLMMQTHASVADDLVKSAADPASREILIKAMRGDKIVMFVVVESIDAVIKSMDGVKQLVPLRTTNYNMKEIVVQDSVGNVLVFAQEIAAAK